jgi:hypothetical protein
MSRNENYDNLLNDIANSTAEPVFYGFFRDVPGLYLQLDDNRIVEIIEAEEGYRAEMIHRRGQRLHQIEIHDIEPRVLSFVFRYLYAVGLDDGARDPYC